MSYGALLGKYIVWDFFSLALPTECGDFAWKRKEDISVLILIELFEHMIQLLD